MVTGRDERAGRRREGVDVCRELKRLATMGRVQAFMGADNLPKDDAPILSPAAGMFPCPRHQIGVYRAADEPGGPRL